MFVRSMYRFPRTRGDGPEWASIPGPNGKGFPRTRGDGPPVPVAERPWERRFPRTRGDGPGGSYDPETGEVVFPAHAGMVR